MIHFVTKNRTLIIITHDSDLLENMDRLIVFNEGKIVKDKSLKEAFLRRPPNNIITVQYGPIEGRPPTVVFNYPPFL
jgi:ABC-type transport system involved in cytochrome bd biosynthesis fused ATPase/permease subunit